MLSGRSENLAIATADRHGANIVLAQDPDADRFSAAERRYMVLSARGRRYSSVLLNHLQLGWGMDGLHWRPARHAVCKPYARHVPSFRATDG
jgi:hypothetical protein